MLEEAPLNFPVGFVLELGVMATSTTRMAFTFHVQADGCAFVQIHSMEMSGRNPRSTLVRMDEERCGQFLNAVDAVKEIVGRYRSSGPDRRLVETYG